LNEDKSAAPASFWRKTGAGADKFDRMLSQVLRRHSEPVPAGFTAMVLMQVREAQEQRILARVVLQERLTLAACITLAGLTVVVAAVFPEIAAATFRAITTSLTGQGENLIDRIPEALKALSGRWSSVGGYSVLGAVFGFAIYSLVELLMGDRATIA
jgi:hypothetical protein